MNWIGLSSGVQCMKGGQDTLIWVDSVDIRQDRTHIWQIRNWITDLSNYSIFVLWLKELQLQN